MDDDFAEYELDLEQLKPKFCIGKAQKVNDSTYFEYSTHLKSEANNRSEVSRTNFDPPFL